jgi:hypothetical protein
VFSQSLHIAAPAPSTACPYNRTEKEPRMKFAYTTRSAMACSSVLMLASVFTASGRAQSAQPAITLDPPTGWELQMHNYNSQGKTLSEAPANFRRLGEVKSGEVGDLHTLTLRFSETVKLTGIQSTPDFRIEQGSSCVEGNVYQAKTTCNLLVRFTPQGAGRRLGSITVSHSNSATPLAFGLGGYSYMPVLSFIPSVITTVPGTYPSSQGLLSFAHNLAVDGSDTLYIADTWNNAVYKVDSSGTIKTISDPAQTTAPWGVAADSFGYVWFSEETQNKIYLASTPGTQYLYSGTGTGNCFVSDPTCILPLESVSSPGSISIDAEDNMIFEEATHGAALSQRQPSRTLVRISDALAYRGTFPAAFAADANSNLYTFWQAGNACEINMQTLHNTESFTGVYSKVVGGSTCGFSGDNGLAGNADISSAVGQIAFDSGGNMYFTDAGNSRVRRVDASTGIIRTIAGNGNAGYTGDGGSALGATFWNPSGVAVDSQGDVYVISYVSFGSAEIVRKIGTQGFLNMGSQARGTAGAAHILTVTNTGNNTMTLTNAFIGGTNAADFTIDSHTTSCMLNNGAQLSIGATCNIGVIFTPSAGGGRHATLTFLDNTATNTNTVTLTGVGVLPSATFKITSPAAGQSFTAAAAITFSVSVTSTAGPAPTGTVQFNVDGANHGGPATLSSGTASTSITGLTQTSHTLSATYSGDANHAAGAPVSISITVTAVKLGSFVSLSSAVNAAASCASPEYSVRVSSASGTPPTGEVRLLDGDTLLSSGSLANGEVVLTPRPLGTGTHKLVSTYAGDALHLPAQSPALVEVVSPSTPCVSPVRGAALPRPAQ